MKRVKLRFANREVEFVDREVALEFVRELSERGTGLVYVVYGPEGCGKTALFKQAKLILEGYGYSVLYVNPLAREERDVFVYSPSIREVVEEVVRALPEPYSKIVDMAITIVSRVMRRLRKPRIAVLMDDIFQAIGLDRAEVYTKILLNLIEYPPAEYEKIVVLVSSSEGVTRERVGRHRWADLYILWNMQKEGFEQLYNLLPDPKPSFEEVWRITGGNPEILERLYESRWSAENLLEWFVKSRKLEHFVSSLTEREREILVEAVEDPDAIFKNLREPEAQRLERKLIELNLVMDVWERSSRGWVDTPPPERDLELGIGRFYAWQTPLHREAVRKALKTVEEL